MDEIERQALEILTYIASDVPRYRGNLWSFVRSFDAPDRAYPEGLRNRMADLCRLVYRDADLLARAHVALCMACDGDDYAEKEIAGRFLSLSRRLTLADTILRHPRASRLGGLAEAIRSGAYTKAQLILAKKLSAEVAEYEAA